MGEVDYTNLLPYIEGKPQNCLSRTCHNFVKNYFWYANIHMHILNISTTSLYGKPFYYLLCKIDILYIKSDILYNI